MKKLLSLIGLSTVASLLVACSSGSSSSSASSSASPSQTSTGLLTKIKEAGVIKVGTEGTYSPYSYHNEAGDLVGYDVEIAQAIGEKLGVKVEFVETEWDSIIAGLDAGRFDIIANQVTITEERQAKYDFSSPYTYIYGALVAKKGTSLTSFEDLKGKTSANSLTSNWAKVAESYGASITSVDGFSQAVELVLSGRVDATINDNVAYYDYLKQHPEAELTLVAQSTDVQQSAIPVVKGNEDLVAAIDQALAELASEGKLTELSEKYFGTDVSKE